MKHLIFSDVHGNLFGLKKALQIGDEHAVDRRWCLGDLVGYNAYPNECVELIRTHNIPTVKGNHEALLFNEIGGFGRIAEKAQHSLKITRRILLEEHGEFLKSLPFLMFLNPGIQLVHANFRDLTRTINSIEKARNEFQEMKQRGLQIAFFGHTHRPEIYEATPDLEYIERITDWGQLQNYTLKDEYWYLINPGTVGVARHGLPYTCLIFDVESRQVMFRSITFTKSEQEALQKRNREVFGGITPGRIPAIVKEKLRRWYYQYVS